MRGVLDGVRGSAWSGGSNCCFLCVQLEALLLSDSPGSHEKQQLIKSLFTTAAALKTNICTAAAQCVRTTQHNTTQHNTTQHNTTQHNSTQKNKHPEYNKPLQLLNAGRTTGKTSVIVSMFKLQRPLVTEYITLY